MNPSQGMAGLYSHYYTLLYTGYCLIPGVMFSLYLLSTSNNEHFALICKYLFYIAIYVKESQIVNLLQHKYVNILY